MKNTVIYSQKHSSDHLYNNNHAPGGFQSSGGTIQKKSATMKKFQYCINSNTIQTIKIPKENHYHFPNEFSNNISNNNSNIIMTKPKKPTQKPVHNVEKNIIQHFVKEYQKIISNLTHYYKYYEWILMKEIQRHDCYFMQIIKIVQNQKKKSHNFLEQQINALNEKIQLQKAALQTKISLLQNNNLKPFEKEKTQLQTQKLLQIPLFQINLNSLDKFKFQIKKYLFDIVTSEQLEKEKQQLQIQKDNFDKESIAETISLEGSIQTQTRQKKDFDEITSSQIEQMTPIHPSIEESYQPNKSTPLEDEDLYCDEDIQNILKDNKIVRRKRYECKQDPIPQESESHEDSLVISNIENFI